MRQGVLLYTNVYGVEVRIDFDSEDRIVFIPFTNIPGEYNIETNNELFVLNGKDLNKMILKNKMPNNLANHFVINIQELSDNNYILNNGINCIYDIYQENYYDLIKMKYDKNDNLNSIYINNSNKDILYYQFIKHESIKFNPFFEQVINDSAEKVINQLNTHFLKDKIQYVFIEYFSDGEALSISYVVALEKEYELILKKYGKDGAKNPGEYSNRFDLPNLNEIVMTIKSIKISNSNITEDSIIEPFVFKLWKILDNEKIKITMQTDELEIIKPNSYD